jgi:hypothetical protein
VEFQRCSGLGKQGCQLASRPRKALTSMATVKLIILPRSNPVLSAFDVNEADSCFRTECPCPTAVGLRTACSSLSARQGWQIARSYVSKPAFPFRRCDRTAPCRYLPPSRFSHCALDGSNRPDLTIVLVAMFICRVTQGVEYRPTHPFIYGVQSPSKFALHKVHPVLLDGEGESVGCRRCSGWGLFALSFILQGRVESLAWPPTELDQQNSRDRCGAYRRPVV